MKLSTSARIIHRAMLRRPWGMTRSTILMVTDLCRVCYKTAIYELKRKGLVRYHRRRREWRLT